MRVFVVIVLLSAAALIPQVRNAVSAAITETRNSVFSSLYKRSRINNKARQRQQLNLGSPATAQPQSSGLGSPVNIAPVRPSTTINISDELRQNRWTTTKQIFY